MDPPACEHRPGRAHEPCPAGFKAVLTACERVVRAAAPQIGPPSTWRVRLQWRARQYHYTRRRRRGSREPRHVGKHTAVVNEPSRFVARTGSAE
jgi:hypothetical protein